MTAERDDKIVAAYADGADPRDIGRLYGVSPAEVERIVAGQPPATQAPPPESRLSLAHTGNRVLVGMLVGLIVQVFAGLLGAEFPVRIGLWAVAAFVTYMLVMPRRR